ncbi:MAG: PqqD family protein [Acidimicrobiia bacterium]
MSEQGGGGGGIAPDTVLTRAPETLERRTRSSVVLLANELPIVLRGTAVAIWDSFAHPRSVAEVARALADAYGASEDVVLQEMLPVLENLHRARALTIP